MMWARRHLYPPNWKALARAVKEQAGWRCVRCHIRQGARRKSKRTGRWYRVWLHAAHVWLHDTLNPHPELQCLCPTCHGRYDYRQRQREARISLERLKHRSLLKRRPVSPPKEYHPMSAISLTNAATVRTSAIEWTDAVWNPLTGCTRVTAGCEQCYAFALHDRRHDYYRQHDGRYPNGRPMPAQYARPFSEVQLLPDRLEQPLRMKQPKRIFVNSMSDLFHSAVPDSYIVQVFNVMRRATWHTFQILTKRAGRLRRLGQVLPWPDNVWIGVSIEEDRLCPRADALRAIHPAVRFLSCEPLLGSLPSLDLSGIDWVITGGESGPGARPCYPDWVREIRDRCQAAGVAFFHKQWGGRTPKAGGRELDGRTWDDYPRPVKRCICEACGWQFRPLEGYYEDELEPTYSYCGSCCHW